LTLYNALERYADEVTPLKRSHQQELSRLRKWQQHPLADLCVSRIRAVVVK